MQDINLLSKIKIMMLQTRNGKRTGVAMLKIAMDFHREWAY